MDLEDELAALRDALEAEKLPYALCGGLALAIHGIPRMTVDIDLLVQPEDVPRIEDAAARLGFRIKARPMSFSGGAVEIRRVTKIDAASGDTLLLDLLLVTRANEEAWQTRQRAEWRGRDLWVVSREGLVLLKKFRSSDQDLVDIKRLREDS
ncbi:MAG TPA: nucleotidyl transferase AbiEii/AbiGii toxin family protein [Thermoanaerobaculia bacterium]|nr:nucleotidyl transferase AbiEii/AbiGii toxin family protein [Thermoanaerobaculia bacterium]